MTAAGARTMRITANDDAPLLGRRWDPPSTPKAIVQIAHGAAEHLGRYDRFARALVENGYAVAGVDHRGHGANLDLHGRGSFGPRGFSGIVDDMAATARVLRAESEDIALVLFGHSMGSFAAQVMLARHPECLDGLILSGTAALDLMLAEGDVAGGLAAANAAFEPARTAFDWLSRDEAEVDAYIADPLCGTDPAPKSIMTMFGAVAGLGDPETLRAAAERQVPVLILSGAVDPIVGPGQVQAQAVLDRYARAGLEDRLHRVYPGARHELLHETNRDEVTADIIGWLDARFVR